MAKLSFLVAGTLIILAGLELTNTTHLFHKQQASKVVVTAGRPVAAPKQSAVTQPVKGSANNNSPVEAARNAGGATDTSGTAAANTNRSQWVVSASGVVTVKQPTANSRFQSGDTVSGSAKIDQVNYRLSDNSVGVVAEGTLSVVNGDFSGTLHFTPRGTGGRLDVFSTDSRGVEYNEVQINVSF